MCSTFICCPWRGPWHFSSLWSLYHLVALFPSSRNRKPALETISSSKERQDGKPQSCQTLLTSAQLKLWEGTCTKTPPKPEREIRAATLHNGPGRSMEKQLSTYIYNTYIKWHHGWVAIYSLLTLLKVIFFCFKVACLVFAVDTAEDSATCSHRRVDLLPVRKNAPP